MSKLRVDCAFEIKAVSDDGRIEGHGAVFGNIDFGLDRIEPGAFKDWLRGAKSIPMLWQHDRGEPIGVWDTMREDKKGLFVSGQLNLSQDSGQPDVPMAWKARALAKQRAVTGLSIGYFPREYHFEEDVRVLEKLDVVEVSLATFPMNDRARVTGVKNFSRADFERGLREEFGLSRKAAELIAARGVAAFMESRESASESEDVSRESAYAELYERMRKRNKALLEKIRG
jgi:HK97 family phage prohead protease